MKEDFLLGSSRVRSLQWMLIILYYKQYFYLLFFRMAVHSVQCHSNHTQEASAFAAEKDETANDLGDRKSQHVNRCAHQQNMSNANRIHV